MKFSEKLKSLRKEHNLTQEELASKIFVSRSLIARYENESVIPTRENVEKLALFFDVKLSDLIDEEYNIELTLSHSKMSLFIDRFFSILILVVISLFIIISLLPIFKSSRYHYGGNPIPNLETNIFSFIQITLLHNNPIVLITMIAGIINATLSVICMLKQGEKYIIWIKMSNYVLFVVILFMIFFSIVFSISYLNNNIYDY